jgi:tetratricopeptide (TPR) repeat protein
MLRYALVLSIILIISCNSSNSPEVKEQRTISQISKELLDNPSDTVLLIKRRNLYILDENWSQALLDQIELFKLDSLSLNRRFDLANMYFNQADRESSYYQKSYLLLEGKDFDALPEALLLRAKLNYLFQNYSESLNDINTYLPTNKFDSEAYFYRGLIYKEQGDLEMAQSQFQTAVEQNPNYIESYEQLAFIYSFNGDSLAEFYFDNALYIDSSIISSWYNRGMYHQSLGDFDKAKQNYQGILRRDSVNIDANYNLGYIGLLESDYESSISYFTVVINSNMNNPSAYFSRGLSYKLIGNFENAKLDFTTTLELDSSFEEARTELANITP